MSGRRNTDKPIVQYMSKLQSKSDAHKQRFAFLVSGVVTLSIFSVWSIARNVGQNEVVAENQYEKNTIVLGNSESDVVVKEKNIDITPFGNFSSGLAASFSALKNGIMDAKDSVKKIDIEELNRQYEATRDQALPEESNMLR